MKNYVQLRYKDTNLQTKTTWAIKVGTGRYWRAHKDGDQTNNFIMLATEDILSEEPARLNMKYGELET